MKLATLDAKFRQAIRVRDRTCRYPACQGKWPWDLQVSHYIGCNAKSVRWDPENCDLLCASCHQMLEVSKPTLYTDWKAQQLGDDGLLALLRRARTIRRPPDEQVLAIIDAINTEAAADFGELDGDLTTTNDWSNRFGRE